MIEEGPNQAIIISLRKNHSLKNVTSTISFISTLLKEQLKWWENSISQRRQCRLMEPTRLHKRTTSSTMFWTNKMFFQRAWINKWVKKRASIKPLNKRWNVTQQVCRITEVIIARTGQRNSWSRCFLIITQLPFKRQPLNLLSSHLSQELIFHQEDLLMSIRRRNWQWLLRIQVTQ